MYEMARSLLLNHAVPERSETNWEESSLISFADIRFVSRLAKWRPHDRSHLQEAWLASAFRSRILKKQKVKLSGKVKDYIVENCRNNPWISWWSFRPSINSLKAKKHAVSGRLSATSCNSAFRILAAAPSQSSSKVSIPGNGNESNQSVDHTKHFFQKKSQPWPSASIDLNSMFRLDLLRSDQTKFRNRIIFEEIANAKTTSELQNQFAVACSDFLWSYFLQGQASLS